MAYNADQDHDIPLSTAAEWTANYRASAGSNATIAHFFGKDAVKALLEQQNAVGMRLYYALDGDGNKQMIITAVDSDGNDLYEGDLLEMSLPCPENCSAANPLNTSMT
jgi:hypothetical protein